MAEVQRVSTAGVDEVWAVLADGWRLASWVVGAARVEAVDESWPAVGARLRYGIGAWPAVLPGAAEVTACRPGHELALHGRTPFGGIDVRVVLSAVALSEGAATGVAPTGATPTGATPTGVTRPGATPTGPAGTTLLMTEDVVSGPARLAPARLRAAAIGARNVETLRRLALLAEAPASWRGTP